MAYPGDARDGDATVDLGQELGGEQLSLAGEDERLPWLESADDYEDDGADTRRIVGLALFGLMGVVALVGLLWWFTRERPDPALVADGSVIEAPAEPYKQRPDDAGGTEVDGTGQTSFAVAEGQAVEGVIAGDAPPAVPAPTPAAAPATAAAGAPQAATPAPAPAVSGVGVQVGAFSTRGAAETAWSQLSSRLPPLQGRSHRIVEGTADSGAIFRLQAVAGTVAEAEALCRSLRAAGGDCQVKR